MNNLPQISEAEYEVMKVVWRHAPINTNEVTELLVPVSYTHLPFHTSFQIQQNYSCCSPFITVLFRF